MKAVILAGGFGTRLSEETHLKPKPLVEIGGRPIIWHIMKYLYSYGIKDFVICCGYKGYMIKEYFKNYNLHTSDIIFDISNNTHKIINKSPENWNVACIDTGEDTMTGGRLRRVKEFIKDEKHFLFTYGDGLCDVQLNELVEFHIKHKKLATVTGVLPPGRFGALKIEDNLVSKFQEKPEGDGERINGGYFILSPKVIDYIKDDKSIWEREPLENLAKDKELTCWSHNNFWIPMDTLRDKYLLEDLWKNHKAPWKVW